MKRITSMLFICLLVLAAVFPAGATSAESAAPEALFDIDPDDIVEIRMDAGVSWQKVVAKGDPNADFYFQTISKKLNAFRYSEYSKYEGLLVGSSGMGIGISLQDGTKVGGNLHKGVVTITEAAGPSSNIYHSYQCDDPDYFNGDWIATIVYADLEGKPHPFEDIPEATEAWAGDAIAWAWENGVMGGASGWTCFVPSDRAGRQMMPITLHRMAGKPVANIKALPFEDVSEGDYYYDAVCWAYENGIISGANPTSFFVGLSFYNSREYAALMLYRYVLQQEKTLPADKKIAFSDIGGLSAESQTAIEALAGAGVFNGKEPGRFLPKDELTRAELAVMLQRLDQAVTK